MGRCPPMSRPWYARRLFARKREEGAAVKALKTTLAINGVVFLARAATNLFKPTSWYVDADVPQSAIDPSMSSESHMRRSG